MKTMASTFCIFQVDGNSRPISNGLTRQAGATPYKSAHMSFLTPQASTMSIAQAQSEMRLAYYGGAMGIYASACAWFVAAFVAMQYSASNAVWALFIGGMLIHPVSLVLNKIMGRPAKHSDGNPLGALALESTVWLIASLPLVYVVSLHRIEWFFPAMLLVIGGRYFTFSSLFGTRVYWLCGASLLLAGYLLVKSNASPVIGALTGAVIETFFATVVFLMARTEQASSSTR